MRFTKMHGIGNDYVYVNCFEQTVANPEKLAIAVSDRHTGIGSDGLILILPSKVADVRMRMFNADGSESEMCGNGVRCVAKYAFDHGLSKSNPMRVETGRGVLLLELQTVGEKVRQVTVDMGEPVLELAKIPVLREAVGLTQRPHDYTISLDRESTLDERVYQSKGSRTADNVFHATFVSMGNPHVVIFVDDVDGIDLGRIGPVIERGEPFPKRVNAHWVELISKNEVQMRTWERGSGITLACGTGACAVGVAGVLTGRTARSILAHLPGGDLRIEWREADNHVYMTGPATEVFSGEWNDESPSRGL
jgi:diaminopimelate epimerase